MFPNVDDFEGHGHINDREFAEGCIRSLACLTGNDGLSQGRKQILESCPHFCECGRAVSNDRVVRPGVQQVPALRGTQRGENFCCYAANHDAPDYIARVQHGITAPKKAASHENVDS